MSGQVEAWVGLAGAALIEGGLGPAAVAWLAAVVALAGFVRGFTGFGTALVMLPLAAIVIRSVAALVLLVLLELAGPLVLVRRAWAEAERAVVARLTTGMVVGLAPGLAILLLLPPEGFRWALGTVALAAVAALASGWRWQGSRGLRVQAGVGAVSGFLGGATGLGGPPGILYLLAGPISAAVVRANLILYLVALDVALLAGLALSGALLPGHLVAALGLAPVFVAANAAGGLVFRTWPGSAAAYRPAALALMAGAALAGLPVWN